MASLVFIHLLNNISTYDISTKKKKENGNLILKFWVGIAKLDLPFMLILRLNHPKVFI